MTTDDFSCHVHCSGCVLIKCLYRGTETSCPMTSCNQNCGAVFHSCKKSEHIILCPFEKVPCLNISSGCSAVLRRRDLAQHLAVCPASIVCCTMEWCRWPVYSRERQERVPFALNNLRARSGQLDVALALRDQRALSEAQNFRPRSVVRSLRSPMTPRHPAVPLFVGGRPNFADDNKTFLQKSLSCCSDDSCEDNCDDAPWITAKKPPGLSTSICLELFRRKSVNEHQNVSKQLDLSNVFDHNMTCSLCAHKSGAMDQCVGNMSAAHSGALTEGAISCEPLNSTDQQDNSSSNCNCALAKCILGKGNGSVLGVSSSLMDEALLLLGNDNKLNNESMVCMESVHADGFIETLSALSASDNKCPCSSSYMSDTNNLNHVISANFDIRERNCSDIETKSDVANEACARSDAVGSRVMLKPTAVPLALNEVLALDLNTEVYSRNNYRPKSMYTFMCGQMFRRDAFNRHFQNVHSDIHSGLSEWLEHRCPLAHYGCTFSVPRLRPKSTTIVFSPILESFGLKCSSCRVNVGGDDMLNDSCNTTSETSAISNSENGVCRSDKEPTPELFASKDFDAAVIITKREASPGISIAMSLTSFPMELIMYIAGFLDSFSLCNLSLTSWHLRNVCRQLLNRRGMVVKEWKRRKATDGRVSWIVSKQVCRVSRPNVCHAYTSCSRFFIIKASNRD